MNAMDLEERLRVALRPTDEWPRPGPELRDRLLSSLPPQRHRRSIPFLVAAVLVTSVVALSALAAVLSFGQRPAPGVPLPSATTRPTAAAPSLAHASRWGLSFDYPATWALTDANVNEHYIIVLGFVGSGSAGEPCTEITPPPGQSFPHGVTCGALWNLAPGTVVVRFESDQLLGSDSPMVNPGPGLEPVEVGGLPAFFTRTGETVPNSNETLSWILSVPNDPGGSYHLTAGIRGPDVAALEAQVVAMVGSLEYDPPVVPLPSGTAGIAAAAAAVGKAIVQLQAGGDAFACFPNTPGAVNAATITTVFGTSLKKPLPVRCSTTVQPTSFQMWRLTLTYSWDTASDRAAGSTSINMLLTPDGTRVGPIVGPGPVPYEP